MPRPRGHIRILLSARVLFDLEEADRIFAEKGEQEYTDYMRCRGAYAADYDAEAMGRRLQPGPMWNFVQTAMRVNSIIPNSIEIGLICKDEAETALPIFRNMDIAKTSLNYKIATCGNPITPAALKAFGADLFLTRNMADAQMAVDNDIAAAKINFPQGAHYTPSTQPVINLGVDGDAAAWGSSGELEYQEGGYEHFMRHEFNEAATPLEPGPLTAFLIKVTELNAKFPKEEQPFRLTLATARGEFAAARALTTAEHYKIKFNGGIYCLGGTAKKDLLQELLLDLFLDDQQVHLKDAAYFSPTGHVPYKTGSPMFLHLQEKAKQAQKPAGPSN